MSRLAERRRRRREYLLRKGEAYASIAASGGLILFSLALLAFGLIAILRSHIEPVDRLIVGLIAVALAGGCGWGVYWGLRDVRATRRYARKIPYAPPVTEADRLKPEEVLVRGAGQPACVPPESLLRTVQGEEETPQEQLLRVKDV
jgi:hypothetical protein